MSKNPRLAIRPMRFEEQDEKLFVEIKKKAKKVSGVNVSASEIMRRALRIVGPQILSGEVALREEAGIKLR